MAKIMKKILTVVLSLAMVACFVPQMNAPAYAEDGSDSIQLDTSTAAPPSGKQDIDLDVIVHDATYPDEIVCIVSSNADGEYALTIANVQATITATITVKGGLGSYSAGHLESGNYEAKVIFEGNSNYNSGSSETTFSVRPQDAGTNFAVKADPAEVTEGDTVTIIPTLPENVTGTVKYYLGTSTDGKLLGETSVGKNLELSTKNGNALLAGTHAITASYTGDYSHLPAVRTVLVAVNHAPADAEDEVPAIQLVQNGTAPNIPGGQGGSSEGGVWFGNYKQSSNGNGEFRVEPVKWRVLANADGKLFLLSDRCLDIYSYYPLVSPNVTWETSVVRAWLNGLIFEGDSTFVDNNFIDSAYSDKEQAAIATTSVNNKKTTMSLEINDDNDTEDQIFLLSGGEVLNTAYGFTDDNRPTPTREAEATDYAADRSGNIRANFWWLRSTSYGADSTSFFVYEIGQISGLLQNDVLGVRPAFNLDLNSVLFASAADGGKPYDVGKLTAVGKNTTGEWKLTLLDDGTITGLDGHKNFALSQVAGVKNGVSVKYTGAQPGNNEYISAIITDKPITEDGAAIKYYGRIAEAFAADGTVTINTAGKLEDGDTLYVFNEQYNGDKKTDYASALQEITISEPVSVYTVTFVDGQGKTLKTETVESGKAATAPADPKRSGYTFTGWDKDFSKVTADMTVTAQWKKNAEPAPVTKVSGTLLAKMIGGKNSVTITWSKIKGAAGYDVFFAKCTKKKDNTDGKLIKTVNAGQILKCTQTGLKKKTAYKVTVKAFVMKDGKKQYVETSPKIHAATNGGKYTNPKKVKVKKTKITIKKGKKARIKAKVVKVKKGKSLLPKYHNAKLRYLSSDPKIATVSKSGKITAKSKGSCKVYVIAVNGAYKTVKVTVK